MTTGGTTEPTAATPVPLPWQPHAEVVGQLLRTTPTDPVDLGGSDRTAVWRVRAGDASYVVKVHRESEAVGYARECSALEALTGSGTVPDLVGCDDATRTIVMQDLGGGDHIAHALLGDDRPRAQQRLTAWVDAVARLHRASTPDRVAAFEESVRRRGASARAGIEEHPGQARERYVEALGVLGDAGLVAQLDDVDVALRVAPTLLSAHEVFSPGDVCPDNNADVGDRLLLLDLEGAQLLHPAWDLAYLTVPWPSCWCAWSLPDDVARAAVERYAEVAGAAPSSSHDLLVTTLVWAVLSPGWFLPRALQEPPDDPGRPEVPGRRAMVLHRLALAAGTDAPLALAALPRFAADLHGSLRERWGDVPLPLGPAWRGTTLAP